MTESNLADVAVIIPMYNRKQTISRAISSVASQSVSPREIFIVDDGSTDGSVDYVQSLLCSLGDNWRIIRSDRRKGANGARNCGALRAESQWLMFLDSDDWWRSDKIAIVLQELHRTTPPPLLALDSFPQHNVSILERGRLRKLIVPTMNVFGGFSKATIDRGTLLRIGLLDEGLQARQDLDIYLRLLEVSSPLIVTDMLTYNDKSGTDRITLDIEQKCRATQQLIRKHQSVYCGTVKAITCLDMSRKCLASGRVGWAWYWVRTLLRCHVYAVSGLYWYVAIIILKVWSRGASSSGNTSTST